MKAVVVIFGLIVMAVGVVFALSPAIVKGTVTLLQEGRRLYFHLAFRFVVGVLLIIAAPQCRGSNVVMVFGILMVVAPVVGLVLGLERMRAMVAWWAAQPLFVVRIWAVAAAVLGLFFVYAGT